MSCRGLSTFADPVVVNAFSEELKDDSRSITELLFIGDKATGTET